MSRYYRAQVSPKKNNDNVTGSLLLLVAALLLLSFIGLFFWKQSQLRPLDEITQCDVKKGPDSVTVLLVDVTDPMTLPQRQDFYNQLERLRNSIPRYGKLAIFKVDATSERLLQPIIERCNPGRGDDTNEYTGNPAKLEKNWEEKFEQPLQEAFESLATASGANRSPILESIQSINLTELSTSALDEKPRRIILASDLLQNTNRISFYGQLPNAEDLAESDQFRMLRTDLRGVDLELWMIQRPDAQQSQPRALIYLWESLIETQGGTVTRRYNVSG